MEKKKLKLKKNFLLEKIPQILDKERRGVLLDMGCGHGEFSEAVANLGFSVIASDVEKAKCFKNKNIVYKQSQSIYHLPFEDSTFDYVLFLEVIEHLEKPFDMIGELSRILKKGGQLILSTPNILNLRSRFRFLFEGSFDFFREPVIDLQEFYIGEIQNMHIIPWRYHELEYMLFRKGFVVEKIQTDSINTSMYPLFFLLYPFIKFQNYMKENKSKRKKGMDFRRINKILLSKKILFGKHLIVQAKNKKEQGPSFGMFNQKYVEKFYMQ